jgi:hypothetical protein
MVPPTGLVVFCILAGAHVEIMARGARGCPLGEPAVRRLRGAT